MVLGASKVCVIIIIKSFIKSPIKWSGKHRPSLYLCSTLFKVTCVLEGHQDYNNTVCSVSNYCKVADGENGETTHLKFCGLHTLDAEHEHSRHCKQGYEVDERVVSILSMYQTHTHIYVYNHCEHRSMCMWDCVSHTQNSGTCWYGWLQWLDPSSLCVLWQ